MPIRYRILRSKLPANREGYIAQVQPYRVVTQEEVAEEMSRRGTTASLPDILTNFHHLRDVVGDMLVKGEIVQTPLGTIYPAVRGTFLHTGDRFDPKRHRVVIRFMALRSLLRRVRDAGVVWSSGWDSVPLVEDYCDIATGKHNGQVTSHNMGDVYGSDMQFDPADPRQGIFFRAEDGTETRVHSVGINMPAQLVFLVPDLAPGRYRLIVRNAAEKSGELREGYLGPLLRVGDADGAAEA